MYLVLNHIVSASAFQVHILNGMQRRGLAFLALTLVLFFALIPKTTAVFKLDLHDLADPSKAESHASQNEPTKVDKIEITSSTLPDAVTTTSPSIVDSEKKDEVAQLSVASKTDSAEKSLTTSTNEVMQGEVKQEQKELEVDTPRVYGAKRLSGGGCPYTASWLAHVNLYKRTGWFLHSTKMETASFNIFDRAKYKYQLSDPADYYVHHMSMY